MSSNQPSLTLAMERNKLEHFKMTCFVRLSLCLEQGQSIPLFNNFRYLNLRRGSGLNGKLLIDANTLAYFGASSLSRKERFETFDVKKIFETDDKAK
jgi:hypothetical protein